MAINQTPKGLQGVKLRKPKQIGEDRTISVANHAKLLEHLQRLLQSSSYDRSRRVRSMSNTELDLLGVAKPQGSDCDRAQERSEGRGAATPDRIYPFGYLKLQAYSADLAALVMPYEAPYTTVAGVDQQDKGDAIAKALRHSAAVFDHRNNVHACIFDGMALDFFAASVDWRKHGYGATVTGISPGAQLADIYGPSIKHLDPYNVTFDTSVPVDKVAEHGEFFAEFELTSKFQLRRMRDEGLAYFTPAELDMIITRDYAGTSDAGVPATGYYFDARLNEGRLSATAMKDRGVETNFTSLFGLSAHTITDGYSAKGVQIVKMLVRLSPKEYGLDNEIRGDGMQIYEILIAGDGLILRATPLEDTGGRFNVVLGTMSFGREFGRHMNHGDAVADMSAFTSSIFNMYKRSKRKGLEGGVTLYNPDVVPLQDLDSMHGGRLPTKMMRKDDQIGRHVFQLADAPDTKNDLRDAASVLQFMDQLMPSSSRPEMVGLDRATEFQAQAVAMTGERELMYHAVMIDGQFMTPIRWLMQFFVMAKANDLSYVDEKTRQLLTVSAQDIQATSFVLTQPSTLIGIDRLRVTNLLSGLINMTLQAGDQMSPLTVALIKHFVDLSGMPVDMAEYLDAAAATAQQQADAQAAQATADAQASGATAGADSQATPTQ